MSHITVTAIPLFQDNYVFQITSEKETVLVDAGDGNYLSKYLLKSNLILTTILLTHFHHDHIGGLEEIESHFPETPILSSQNLQNREAFPLFNDTLTVIPLFTSGHTDRDCCFYLPDQQTVFTGDTLFTGGCGRVKVGGDYQSHYRAMQILRQLPNETRVYGGHEYLSDNVEFIKFLGQDTSFYENLLDSEKHPSLATTIGDEKKHNPFMGDISEEEFIRLRKLKNNF